MRKTAVFFYAVIIAAMAAGYFYFSEEIKSFAFTGMQKFSPSAVSMDKIIFIEDDFSLEDYLTLLNGIKKVENSAVLFLPQVFNTRTGDYLENINPDEVKKMKQDYRNFKLKLAENQDIIPVIFLGRTGKTASRADQDISSYAYFKASPKFNGFDEYNSTKVGSEKAWYSISGAGFYENYSFYPFGVPLLFKYDGNIFVSAAVEAVRRYYRFPKSRVKFEDGRLKIGDIIDMPLLKNGEMIIRGIKGSPKVYSLKEFLAAPQESFNNKIIIIKSMMNSRYCMESLGAAVACIMEGKYVKYSPPVNYVCALIFLVLMAVLYRQVKFISGTIFFIMSAACVIFLSSWLLSMDIYMDTPLFTALNFAAFFTVYYFRAAAADYDRQKRTAVFSRYMHPKTVRKFVSSNSDIKIKNVWLKAYVLYLVFEDGGTTDPNAFKINFEKTREIIYNRFGEFLIKNHGNCDLAVIIPDEKAAPENVIGAALDLRNRLEGLKFNIILNYSDVYIFEVDGALWMLDKKYAAKEAAQAVEKRKNIIISESDIQKYINIIKFQKLPSVAGMPIFNVAGLREGADNEN